MIITALTATLSLTSCDNHTHAWTEADCTNPKTCSVCGETEGAPLGHTPETDDGDCTTAVKCSVCEGTAIAAKAHVDEDGNSICDNEGCTYSFATPINTVEELFAAFENGGSYKLMKDLDAGEDYLHVNEVTLSLDLNGNTITTSFWAGMGVGLEGTLNLSNGTVRNTNESSAALSSYGNTHISNCTLEGNGYWSLSVNDNTTVVDHSVIKYGINASESYTEFAKVVATNNVTITDVADSLTGICVDLNGSIILGFDPTELLVSGYNEGVVKDNGDGTWTVAVPK